MSEFWDETFEEYESRERNEFYFGDYSKRVRTRLLSKNIKRPDSIYDLYYTTVRENLLNKNVPNINIDLDKNSQNLRNSLISKNIQNYIDLEKSGNLNRTKLEALNTLKNNMSDLDNMSKSIRNQLLSSNVDNQKDNTAYYNSIRESLLSKNVPGNIDLDKSATIPRTNLESFNTPKNIDLDKSATIPRTNLESFNTPKNIDLDKSAIQPRTNLESFNTPKNIDLDKSAIQPRTNLESFNIPKLIDLDINSVKSRESLLSKNVPGNIDLDKSAIQPRTNLESFNIPKLIDLDINSVKSRESLLSKNVPGNIDLDKSAIQPRTNLESFNTPKNIDLDKSAIQPRTNLESFNTPKNIDLDKSAIQPRTNLESFNTPKNIDLDKSAIQPRTNLESFNTPKNIDLDKSAIQPRTNLESFNTPKNIDLDKSAIQPRTNLESFNTPKNIDLDKSAIQPRTNLESFNTPKLINLDASAVQPRNNLESFNVPKLIDLDKSADIPRAFLESFNVPKIIDLEADAVIPRNNLEAFNIPKNIDLDANAVGPRNNLEAFNIPKNIDLDKSATIPRKNLESFNSPKNIDLDNSGGIYRSNLISKNVPNNIDLDNNSILYRNNLLAENDIDTVGTNVLLPGGDSVFIGISNLAAEALVIRNAMLLGNKIVDTLLGSNIDLQVEYGLAQPNNTNNNNPAGSLISSIIGTVTSNESPVEGKITKAIRTYNLTRNMNYNTNDVSLGSLTSLLSPDSPDFSDLIASTIGTFSVKPMPTFASQEFIGNPGEYLQGSADDILRPAYSMISPDSITENPIAAMAQTEPSDAIENSFYSQTTNRGIQYVINKIKNPSNTAALAKNYDPQNSTQYVISAKGTTGKYGYSYSKYTIANPYENNIDNYATMEFSIENYSIKDNSKTMQLKQPNIMAFPPYIKNFSIGNSVSWNSTNFLGRPEAVYTYNHSERSGVIDFMVLTDFGDRVKAGNNFGASTSSIFVDTASLKQSNNSNFTGNKQGKTSGQTFFAFNSKINDGDHDSAHPIIYDEQDNMIFAMSDVGFQELPQDKINRMIAQGLFQPAFFSGSKVDFTQKLDFLTKCGRPSRNNNTKSGFSFINPPVCHLHLGRFLNHDVIIESIDFDFTDAPWALDGNSPQPMWANVHLGFKIIGTYNADTRDNTPLSDDIGGVFSYRQK